MNITETCDDNLLNLITDIQTETATTADNYFLQTGVERTANILSEKIDNLHTDGAYNSEPNQTFCQKRDIQFHLTGLQGAIGRYAFERIGDKLFVTDTQTGEVKEAEKRKNKWRISTENGYRYFKEKEIDAYYLRIQIAQQPKEIKYKRNNVEAAMFQLSLHLRNNKTRYRGYLSNSMWAILRCIGINLRRIVVFMGKLCQDPSKTPAIDNIVTFYSKVAFFVTCFLNNIGIFLRIRYGIYFISNFAN